MNAIHKVLLVISIGFVAYKNTGQSSIALIVPILILLIMVSSLEGKVKLLEQTISDLKNRSETSDVVDSKSDKS